MVVSSPYPQQAHSAKIKIFAKDKIERIGKNANRAWAVGIGAYYLLIAYRTIVVFC